MKIQYFGSDLSYALDIGEIGDMYVETLESGVQVLRIECSEETLYKTIRAPKKPASKAKATRTRDIEVSRGPARPMRFVPPRPMSFGDKMLKAGADFMKRNKKPPFMKDAGF